MKPAKLITSTLLLATGYLLLTTYPVQAEVSTGLSAIPPRLEIEAKPDGVITKGIKVRNESSESKTIKVSVRDFVVTDNKGTPNFLDNSDNENNRWAASSWIQISPSSITVKPGETKSLTITVLPPTNALPGGHYAAVIYTPDSSSIGSATGASVQTNVGTLVYVTIPGDINQSATVQTFTAPKFSEFGPINFKATVKNSSDIHIQPAGSIVVSNWFGGQTAKLAIKETNIFPYTTRSFENTLDKKWLFGRYKATLNAFYGTAGGLMTATIFFWVIPWRLLILLAAAIGIILTLIFIFKNKPKKGNLSGNNEVAELEKELEALKKKYKDQ
ncbi:MAG: hypothetical protein KIH89_003305 [Candidatus Shapirobacteria bacterium]|nr:hypothetical protein [Candidatus Shapirobacteria bacterium]